MACWGGRGRLTGEEGRSGRKDQIDHRRPVSAVLSGLLLSDCKREAVRRVVRRRVTEAQDSTGCRVKGSREQEDQQGPQ